MTLSEKRILLIIGGGIAAYKSLGLIRRLRERGANVRVVLTEAATHFVTPLSASAISGERTLTDLFDPNDEHDVGHIRLSREADLIVVAPATANLLGKIANGLCDDLATNVLMASDKPVLLVPAMNPFMWRHPANQRNADQLAATGYRFVGPEVGEMAESGEAGVGRLAEPLQIVAEIEAILGAPSTGASGSLSGRRALVTAGPTHEPIDPVRYLANRSSGRQGYAVAKALADQGASVTLISGPVALEAPDNVILVKVETAKDMLDAVERALPVDIAVMAAAVADWRAANPRDGKIKKRGGTTPSLELAENADILKELSHNTARPKLVVGFAAETDDLIDNAKSKLLRKGCDWIVANDVSPETGIMGGSSNQVHIITQEGVEDWPRLGKNEVAIRLVERISLALDSNSDQSKS